MRIGFGFAFGFGVSLLWLASCNSHKACGNAGGDESAACLVEADVMARVHEREAPRVAFEQQVVARLTTVDYDCANDRPRIADDPVIKRLEGDLPGLATAARADGVEIALSCPVVNKAGPGRPEPGIREDLSSRIIGVFGSEEAGGLSARGRSRDEPGRQVSWGEFQGNSGTPFKGVTVESTLPLPHAKARITTLYRL